MIIGVPRERLQDEYRVAVTPSGVELLVVDGHTVLIEDGAGDHAGFSAEMYRQAGAGVVDSALEIFESADLLVKVKEPKPDEVALLRPEQTLFTFFHFAADEQLSKNIMQSGCVAIAYETVAEGSGRLPLLTPMSEVAGRMAVQQGAKYLEKSQGGAGILLGGVPGVAPASVVILGGGVVGSQAALIAAGMGASVSVVDLSLDRLRYLSAILPANVTTHISTPATIRELLFQADLVISGVLIPGARAPQLVSRAMLADMKAGSVMVDVAIDQGGSFATSRPTTHAEPIFTVDGVLHYCVTNMPGVVPLTSTQALTNATLPYLRRLAGLGYREAILTDPALRAGANIILGEVVHSGVADAFALPFKEAGAVLGV
jgi:alanine dehydrogenase